VNGVRTRELRIVTPEGITFALPLASPVVRCLALAVDFAVILAAQMVLSTLAGALGWISLDAVRAFGALSFFALSIGYGLVLEWFWRGQTLGKRIFQLRVMDERGLNLHFSQILIRNLLRCVDNLPLFYAVGGAACWFSARGQRLGDFAGNTIVVRAARVPEPNVEQLLSGRYNSFRAYPHLEAQLRRRVAPREAALAVQALLRREEFDPAARVDLFARLAGFFREQVPFPPEAAGDLSDEQAVRNVVDTLFRAAR